ncbi:ABC transporter substrate-binding protein [uncultured Methylobacterium sp.]|uniref:ABC transporter substrate-binding protein n=1 Tax=uncultured Methylobacterium sp. TaxID=157278 RepID=UPI0035CA6205
MLSRRGLLAAALAGLPVLSRSARADAPVLRVGSLPFGTVAWEAAVIKARGLDAENGFSLDVVKLAGTDAARIAFVGGQVDTMLADLFWSARLGNEGRPVRFLPFSTSEGAVMVRGDGPIRTLKDLAGRKLGVAGGPLDKNWLLLKTQARDGGGIDLEREAEIAYGAAPLITLKLEQGALDAALTYWTYCARLEPKGYRRLISADDVMRAFGAIGSVALSGYLFEAAAVAARPQVIAGFARAARMANDRLAGDPAAWELVRPLMSADDEPTFQALRREYLAGIPRRTIAAERGDGERLYAVMSRLGGERLVGAGTGLPPDLYYDGAGNG